MLHMTPDTTVYDWFMSVLATSLAIAVIAVAVVWVVGWAMGFNSMYDSDDMDTDRRRNEKEGNDE